MHDRPEHIALVDSAGRAFRRRWLVFVISFLLSCALGMAYVFLRPPVYRSTASLLITPRVGSVEESDTLEVRPVAVQQHVVSHPSVLSEVFRRFASAGATRDAGPELVTTKQPAVLSATVVPETNILELRGEGPRPADLPQLVSTWIDVYLEAQAPTKKSSSQSTSAAMRGQLGELEARVQKKRDELAEFRGQHDIASLQREENRVLARLNGLTASLNKAEEAEVTARARVEAIQEALAEGQPIPLEKGDGPLDLLEARGAELRGLIHGLQGTYTPEYLAENDDFARLQEQAELLDAAIESERGELSRQALAEAEFELATARQSSSITRQQLEEYKQTAAEFSTQFAQHEALVQDLAQLEDLYRNLQEQVIQAEVMRETLPPDVSVAQSASMPGRPVRPAYLRDAAIALGASLLVALGAVMFDVQLTRPVVPASLPETRTVFYPLPASHPLLGTHLDEFARVPPMQALPPGRQRELSPDDVIALLRVSDLPTRALVTALLSGLAIDEAVALRWRDIDAEASLIRVPGDEARTITLPRDAARFFLDNAPADYDPGALVWGDGGGGTQRASYIDALVASAARAADVDRPAEITCGTLRFTYLAFLARQGVPLDQLPRFVGRVSAEMQSHLQLLSPPGRRETTPGVFLGEWAFDGALGANRGDPTS